MKKSIATIGVASVLTLGGVDASSLSETPIDRVETIANERVEVKQMANTVYAEFPWKDQPGLKLKYDMGEPTIEEKFKDKRKAKVITETVDYGDGGLKVDILLNEKPDTNCFSYQIEGWEQYNFYYQPALTEEEIANGDERPEEIVGSYAVYHKTLKNHKVGAENYATGKVAHIPYPYVWEVDNEFLTKHRAESFDINNGVMNVCVSQDFLDKAKYPVRVDPTFGYTSIGATGGTANEIFCSSDDPTNIATENGTVTSIFMYSGLTGWGAGEFCRAGIYLGTDADPDSGGFLSETSELEGDATSGWKELTGISQSITSGSLYSICGFRSPNTISYRSDTLTSGGGIQPTGTYPTWSALTSTDNIYSVYASYTADSGGGTNGPVSPGELFINNGGVLLNDGAELFVHP